MKVLVTGGAGYVGSTLTLRLLAEGHKVTVFDSLLHGGESLLAAWSYPGFRFLRGDIRDPNALGAALHNQDAVVHLAAIVGDPACAAQPDIARSVNLEASLALLDLCAKKSVNRLVFASTCSNYGKMPDPDGYVEETSELNPVSLYAETKVAVERAILQGHSGVPVSTVLRFATIFGVSPRMRFDLTVNQFVFEMLIKRELVVFGEAFWRPYIHVQDAARAIALVLSSRPSVVGQNVFNAGDTSNNFQKRQLVDLIRPYAPTADVRFIQKVEDPRDYRVSFKKIERELDFRGCRSVKTGIAELVELAKSGIITDFEAQLYCN